MICFVLINYNAINTTRDCVENIKNLKIQEKKIIIVDNASPNSSGEKLKETYKNDEEVKVVLNDTNIGFAKANNIGYEISKKYKPQFIVIMNNDMKIKTVNFEDALKSSFEKNDFDVLGPDVYSVKYNYHQNPQRKSNYSLKELKRMRTEYWLKVHLKFIFWIKWHVVARYFKFKEDEKKSLILPEDTTYPLHGSFYVISRKFYESENTFFYPNTFMYMESYILHYQLLKGNKKMVYDPSIKVDHYEDVSTDTTFKDRYKKAIFTNKCMLDSCEAYINLITEGKN